MFRYKVATLANALLKHRSDEGPAWYGDRLDRLDRHVGSRRD
jgi:hypothetical protein